MLKGIACKCLLICDFHYCEHDGNSDRYCLAVQWISRLNLSRSLAIATTMEKSILPYITENIPNTPMQHGYKTQHSTVTALHTLNNTVAKGFKPNGSPCANNQCSSRYEQSFRHNKHTHTNQKAATDKHSRHNH